MKITNNNINNLLGFNPMTAMLENGHLTTEKTSSFNSINNDSGSDFTSDFQALPNNQQINNNNSLFSSIDEINNNNNNTGKFATYSNSLMQNMRDHNNTFFQFDMTDNTNNSDLLNYNSFTHFSSLIDSNSGKIENFILFKF